MTGSNLFHLLKTLSQEEIKKLEEFIISPYFNNSERVIKLFKAVKKYHPDYLNINLSKKKIYSKLFPGKKYQDNTLRVLIHYLSSLVEKFFAIKRFENNHYEYNLCLARELSERNLCGQYEKVYKHSLKLLDKTEIKNDDHFLYKYEFYSENLDFVSMTNAGIYDKILDKVNIPDITNSLTYFYLSKCLKSYNMILNLKWNYNKSFSKIVFEDLYSKIDISLYTNVPVIEIYYYLVKLHIESENKAHFYKVIELLHSNKKCIEDYDIANVYINLGNYCIRQIRLGKADFKKERFIIYKEEIKYKTYLINDHMSPKYYMNAVNAGLQSEEFQWVKNFISEYKNCVQENLRDNLFNYCHALYLFYTEKYEKCLLSLSEIVNEDYYLKFQLRTLQLMTFYEINLEESLYSSFDSFRHFIKNNKLMLPEQKNIFLNFIKYLSKVVKYRSDDLSFDINLLRSNLLKEKVTNKDWLLKKIDHLIVKRRT